jgi:hypothetical protein
MSGREYFDLRYTVPGFVFILIIVGVNYSIIVNLFTRQGVTDVFSISISIITLFASSAIGFLISQVWFGYYHLRRVYAKIIRMKGKKLEDSLITNFGWIKKEKADAETDYRLGSAIDYILNTQCNDNLFRFFQRKIDLFHTMSSICVSFILGLSIGIPIRVILLIFDRYYTFNTIFDLFLFIFTIITSVCIIAVLLYLRREIFFEYHPIMRVLFDNDSTKEEINQKMRNTFNQDFSELNRKPDNPSPEV